MNELGAYRDLVVHTCPLAMTKRNVFIRCSSQKLTHNQELPRIIAPIPLNPNIITNNRNTFKYFKDFDRQLDEYLDKSNTPELSQDLLEYSLTVMQHFSELSWRITEKCPIKGKIFAFNETNIVGGVAGISVVDK